MLKRDVVIYTVLISFLSQTVALAAGPNSPNPGPNQEFEMTTLTGPSAPQVTLVNETQTDAQIDAQIEAAVTSAAATPKYKLSDTISPAFLLTLIDPRDVILPVTPRKVAYWTAYSAIIAGAVTLNYYYPYGQTIYTGVKNNTEVLAFFILGFEQVMTIFMFIVASYPEKNPDRNSATFQATRDPEAQGHPSESEETALVIPCHNSARLITKTITAALKHFRPEQIFIVDNGRTEAPADDTKEIVHAIDPKINYLWSPIGNKNVAQYAGTLAAKDYKYIMTTDDDVSLPENFVIPVRRLNDDVKAMTFPIEAVDANGEKPLLVGWQDIEYKIADLGKIGEDRFCGVLYPHGAASFWEKETFIKALKKHDLDWFSEDAKLGFALQEMGLKMGIAAGANLETEVPSTLIGKAPNYYMQRVRSWEMGRQVITHRYLKHLFSMNGQKAVSGFCIQKSIQAYTIFSNAVDYARVPLMIIMGTNPEALYRLVGFTAAPIVPLVIWKLTKLRKRPDLDTKWAPVLTYPFYKIINNVASILGAVRAICIYWPNFQKVPTIPQMEANNDPRCIWLRADWNPQGETLTADTDAPAPSEAGPSQQISITIPEQAAGQDEQQESYPELDRAEG